MLVIIIAALIGAGVYFALNRQTPAAPAPTPKIPASGPITINGEIACLPKKGSGAQTLECAIGLKGLDGQYYGLKNLSEYDQEYKFSVGGLPVEAAGVFSQEEISAPDGNKYDVTGVIELTSIKEIKEESKKCVIGGCSGQICAAEEIITTCEFKPEYACYNSARCERNKNNQCGWVMTEELKNCLANSVSASKEEQISLREGQRESSFLLEKIYSNSVTGLNFWEYPVATGQGYPVTLGLGEIVSNGCTITLKLVRIEENAAIFSKQTDFNRPCPICLAKDTLIDMPAGKAAVQSLQKGDMVWTANAAGRRVAAIVLKAAKTPVPATHKVAHIILEDARELFVSPGHPVGDGRTIGELFTGDILDGRKITGITFVSYPEGYTYDILPSGETGFYWANGILIGSTLR